MTKRVLTVKEMVDIQDRLNELTQENWKAALTKDHFRVAMFDELAELLGSGRKWKWWKKSGSPDTFNEKIEVIDVVHFYLSVMMLEYNYFDHEMILGWDDTEKTTTWLYLNKETFSHKEFVRQALQLLSNASSHYLNDFIRSAGLLKEEVSSLYMAKATLNEIRQSQGYKTGEYKKVVDGLEDNQRLQGIVEEFIVDREQDLEYIRERVINEFFVHET